jgi:hypothetical protein
VYRATVVEGMLGLFKRRMSIERSEKGRKERKERKGAYFIYVLKSAEQPDHEMVKPTMIERKERTLAAVAGASLANEVAAPRWRLPKAARRMKDRMTGSHAQRSTWCRTL